MQKTNRPFLLTGLIIMLIMFLLGAVNSIMQIVSHFNDVLDPSASIYLIVDYMIDIVILINVTAGIICACISMSKWNLSPKVFKDKIDIQIATFSLSAIFTVFFISFLMAGFHYMLIIMACMLVLALVFIMLDICLNNRWLKKQSNYIYGPNNNYGPNYMQNNSYEQNNNYGSNNFYNNQNR